MRDSLNTLAAAAPRLQSITLRNCSLPEDLTTISAMGKLRQLILGGCTSPDGPVDLSHLARQESQPTLTIELMDQEIRGRDSVGHRVRVTKFTNWS